MSDVRAYLAATVWKVLVSPGDLVEEDDTIMILESMKMEIPVEASTSGTVEQVLVAAGDAVSEDQLLAILS